ncbi:hypothetical protein KM043_002246 [Ampulex compressa]|nr:hypothetical protein KM043_002246 [Ampulex compressa]
MGSAKHAINSPKKCPHRTLLSPLENYEECVISLFACSAYPRSAIEIYASPECHEISGPKSSNLPHLRPKIWRYLSRSPARLFGIISQEVLTALRMDHPEAGHPSRSARYNSPLPHGRDGGTKNPEKPGDKRPDEKEDPTVLYDPQSKPSA